MIHDRHAVTSLLMDIGAARGVTVLPLESGEWAWTAWTAGHRLTGVEASEMAAQQAGGLALDRLISEAAAAALSRRELPKSEERTMLPHPRA
jgi:hypothetical protein